MIPIDGAYHGSACAYLSRGIERSCPNRRCSCGQDWEDACPRSPVYGADGRCPHCGLRPTIACTCWACGATWTTKAGPTTCPRCGGLYLTAQNCVDKQHGRA